MKIHGVFVRAVSIFLFYGVFAGAAPSDGSREKTGESKVVLKALKQKEYKEVEEVTDAELRAKAGSQSKWSLSGYLGYSGPRIDRLHEEVRPNPDNQPQPADTSVQGSLGIRYRWSSSTSISADTGMRFFTPLAGARRGEVSDPGVSLERLYKLWGLQMRSRYSLSATTAAIYKEQGQVGTFNMAHDFKRRIGGSQSPVLFSVGSSFNWFFFERAYQAGQDIRGVSNYLFTVFPGLQYNIRDNLQIGTSIAAGYSNPRSEDNWWNWNQRMGSQRLTLGYGVTRDIFLAPYLNFFPEEFTWDTTSVNMNMYINLF